MSKQYNIKWRDKDVEELNKVVKNFNQKISRVAKKNPNDAEFLPEKISRKTLKEKIKTRQDFNRELNSLRRFSRRGVEEVVETEKGLKLTQYEIQETKIKTRIVNIKRAKERKKLDIDVTKGTMGQVSAQNLRPKTFTTNKTAKEWDKFVESLEKEISSTFKEEQLQNYKEQYLESVRENLGSAGDKLYDLVKGLDVVTLFENSVEVPTLSISFTSEPLDVETISERAYQDWLNVLN